MKQIDVGKLYNIPDPYLEDCQQIVDVCRDHGWEITLEQAKELWEAFSSSCAAGWLLLSEYSIYAELEPYLEKCRKD